jgi:ubiquinone/menaquinone biosynthesis C-methylase UbiE
MAMDLDQYRQQSRETWDEMAAGWERRRPWLMELTGRVNDWLADHADPKPGQTVLEIAAGTGDLGLNLAERVGGSGRVISTDFAREMVEVARRNGESRGLTNVEHRVLDAERMDLEDASVDAVVCRFGYMLMADPSAALAETRRVLRPGGPLCFAVWRTPDLTPWAALPGIALVQRGHLPPPEPGAPGIFALGDRDRLRELVEASGFAEPVIEEVSFNFRYADFEDFWDAIVSLAGPLARVANALPDDERRATQDAIKDSIASFLGDDGSYTMPASTWGVAAR